MKLKLVTAPTQEAVDLESVKAFALRVTSTDEDARIQQLIQSAREEYEGFTSRILMESTWELYLDGFPSGAIELPGPLKSVASITYRDTSGIIRTLAASKYVVDAVDEPATVSCAYGQSWPSTYDGPNAVIVRFTSGYPSPEDVPAKIKDGIYLYIEEQYDGVDRRQAYENCWVAKRVMDI